MALDNISAVILIIEHYLAKVWIDLIHTAILNIQTYVNAGYGL